MAQPLRLNIAIADYGHTRALKSGAVPIEGIEPNFIEVKPIIGAFRRVFGPPPPNVRRIWSDMAWALRQCADHAAEPGRGRACVPSRSVDRAGRYFPLTLAASLPGEPALAQCFACNAWFAQIEKAAQAAMAQAR
jgi:hypothetical protein